MDENQVVWLLKILQRTQWDRSTDQNGGETTYLLLQGKFLQDLSSSLCVKSLGNPVVSPESWCDTPDKHMVGTPSEAMCVGSKFCCVSCKVLGASFEVKMTLVPASWELCCDTSHVAFVTTDRAPERLAIVVPALESCVRIIIFFCSPVMSWHSSVKGAHVSGKIRVFSFEISFRFTNLINITFFLLFLVTCRFLVQTAKVRLFCCGSEHTLGTKSSSLHLLTCGSVLQRLTVPAHRLDSQFVARVSFSRWIGRPLCSGPFHKYWCSCYHQIYGKAPDPGECRANSGENTQVNLATWTLSLNLRVVLSWFAAAVAKRKTAGHWLSSGEHTCMGDGTKPTNVKIVRFAGKRKWDWMKAPKLPEFSSSCIDRKVLHPIDARTLRPAIRQNPHLPPGMPLDPEFRSFLGSAVCMYSWTETFLCFCGNSPYALFKIKFLWWSQVWCRDLCGCPASFINTMLDKPCVCASTFCVQFHTLLRTKRCSPESFWSIFLLLALIKPSIFPKWRETLFRCLFLLV